MHVCRIHLFLLAKFHQEMKLLFEKKKRFWNFLITRNENGKKKEKKG
jgi:hypothetical protein